MNNIDLYTKCELEARRRDLKSAEAFIINACVEKMRKIFAEKNQEKLFKKNLDLWIVLKDEADRLNMAVPELVELICYAEAFPDAPSLTESFQPVAPQPLPTSEVNLHASKGLMDRLNNAMSLPKG
jgi:hypothetical protein